jgi:pyruvate carboxylase
MHTVAIYSHEDRMSAHRQKVRDVSLSEGNLANYRYYLSPRLMKHTLSVPG